MRSTFKVPGMFADGVGRPSEPWGGTDIFPGGALPFKATEIVIPSAIKEGVAGGKTGMRTISAAALNDQLLHGNLPVTGKRLVEEVRGAYEENKDQLPYAVDYDRRGADVPVVFAPDSGPSHYHPLTGAIKLSGDAKSDEMAWTDKYVGSTSTGKPRLTEDIAIHEANHSWTTGGGAGNKSFFQEKVADLFQNRSQADAKPGETYSTSSGAEYLTAAVTGFNTLRNVTGRKMNTPAEMHRALDEIEKDPKILDNFPNEGGRIFNDYLNIKESDPKSGEMFRNALARDCQFLAGNAPPSKGTEPSLAVEEIGSLPGRSRPPGLDGGAVVGLGREIGRA